MTGEIIPYASFLASRQRRERVIAEFRSLSTRPIKSGIPPGVPVTIDATQVSDQPGDTPPVGETLPQEDIDRHGQRPSIVVDTTDRTPPIVRYRT